MFIKLKSRKGEGLILLVIFTFILITSFLFINLKSGM